MRDTLTESYDVPIMSFFIKKKKNNNLTISIVLKDIFVRLLTDFLLQFPK